MYTRVECEGFTLEVARLPKGAIVNWALKATMQDQEKFRGYYYKQDAIDNINEWRGYDRFGFEIEFFGRHNWNTLESLMRR